MMTTAPGWYDDGHGALRWWDGAQWTEHVAAPDAEPANGADATGEGETAVLPPLSTYPGGYPGAAYPTDGGAFISATEPRKSGLWIVWVVLGVILLGAVIALSVLVPMLFMNAASGGGASPQPTTGEYSEADQQAAIEAVELYDEAYQTADCDAFMASTTEAFRDLIEIPDCETFTANAADFSSAYLEYEMTVTSVEDNGTSLSVFTTETYESMFDEDGNETEELEAYEDTYEYIVVPVEGGWAIDDAYVN